MEAKKSIWSKFADGHKEKQALNPFSETFDREKLKSLLSSRYNFPILKMKRLKALTKI